MAIDHSADKLGQESRLPLGLASDIAKAINQRHVGLVQIVRRRFNGGVNRGRFPVDQGIGVKPFRCVILEPGLAETASILRFGDPLAIGMQFAVAEKIAEAASAARANAAKAYLDPVARGFAVLAVGELGSRADVPLLQEIFTDKRVFYPTEGPANRENLFRVQPG